MASRRRTGWRIPPILGLSLLIHIVVLAIVAGTSLGRGCNPEASFVVVEPVDRGPIDVTMIEPTVLNPYASRPTEEEQKKELQTKIEEAKKPEESRDMNGQVVDSAKPAVEIRPDQAKYLGKYDSKVEHETKAPTSREPGQGKKVASVGGPPAQAPRPKIEPVAPKAPTHGEHGEGKLAMRSATPIDHPTEPGKEDGLVKAEAGTEAPRGAVQPGENKKAGRPGEEQKAIEGREAQPEAPEVPSMYSDLRPTPQMLARVAASGGSDDYLKDVDDGEDTFLNTKRWKYWDFFDRVKKGVAHQWRPDLAYRLRDPTGQIYGFKNRFTVLKVSLKPDGSLSHLSIERPSGVDFLDDEAVSAMKTAQPFPNPPEGLIDPASHLITFRFGFMFELGGPRFKVYRQ